MYLLSYIRGDFVYCPVLLVLFNLYKGKVPENKEGFYGIFYKFRDAFV